MRRILKKIFLFGVLPLALLIIGAALILPSVFEVDRYRPQLVDLANQKINGTLSLGKLRLVLWGKIAVQVEKAELMDSQRRTLLSVDDLECALPVMKLISGNPEVQIRMIKPVVQVEKDGVGGWNFESLIRKEIEKKGSESQASVSSPSEQKKDEVPSWLKKAGVSLLIQEADLKFKDLGSQSEYELKQVSIQTGLLSLEKIPTFSLSAVLDTKIGNTGSAMGPFNVQAKQDGESIRFQADFSKLAIEGNQGFKKTGGSALRVGARIAPDSKSVRIQEGELVWEDAKLQFQGEITKPGSTEKPEGKLNLSLSGLPIRGPHFKQSLALSGEAELTLDSVEKSAIHLKGKGFDLAIQAQVKSFSEPKLNVQVRSNQMDLDELLDWQAMKEASRAKLKSPAQSTLQEGAKKASATPSSEKSPAHKATGTVSIQLKELKAYNIVIEPVNGNFALQNRVLNGGFEEAKVLGGRVKLNAALDGSKDEVHYQFQGQLNEISLDKAVASQVEWLKNTMVGSLNGEISGKGFGLEAEKAKKNLRMTGKIQVKPARLSTIDINQMIREGVNKSLSKVGEKIPALKGKELKLDSVASEFQQITATFSLADGYFRSPDFYAQAVPQKGLEARGETQLNILDFGLDANWEISDPFNILKMKEIGVEESGVRVESLLLEKGKPFRFPVRIRGNLFQPDYDYGAIAETLANIALKNVSIALQDRAKGELKKQAEEKLKQAVEKAPPQIQQILKGIFK